MKYQVTETRLNARGDKVDVRVVISEEESIFLNLDISSIGDKIDEEMDKIMLAREEAKKAQEEERRIQEEPAKPIVEEPIAGEPIMQELTPE